MGHRRVADSYGGYRARLVDELRAGGIKSMAVLAAVAEVPRHLFVPEALRARAYEDTSLPIGNGQTISRPLTHARYLEALNLSGRERVLEVGTGSGYQSALLGYLADHVISLERIADLAIRARKAIEASGCGNVAVAVADGTLGWPALAPYDAILVSAAGTTIPKPLTRQLSPSGRMLIPLQRGDGQVLIRVSHGHDGLAEEELGEAQFVPLTGRRATNDED